MLESLLFAAKTLFRRSRFEHEMREEVKLHIEHRADDLERSGLTREEALRTARLEFGAAESHKEMCREAAGASGFDLLACDLRIALRSMRRSPQFTAVAVLSLALGIGANTAVFGLLTRLMLNDLAIRDAGSLQHVVLSTARGPYYRLSYPKFLMLRDNFDLFQSLFGWGRRSLPLVVDERHHPVDTLLVTGTYFESLGIRPHLGRLLGPDDDQPGTSNAVVLSHRLWRTFFNGDAKVVGRSVRVGTQVYLVAGVAPADFRGLDVGEPLDAYIPYHAAERFAPAMLKNEGMMGFFVMGRLKQGVPMTTAQAALRDGWLRFSIPRQKLLGDRSRPEYLYLQSGTHGFSPVREQFGQGILTLMALVAVVFLIACANIATLLFVRGVERTGEMSVRQALGATRMQLVRHCMTECLLIAVMGGAAGVLLARWITDLLLYFLDEADRPGLRFQADWTVIGATLVLTVAAGLLFGLLPAFRATQADVQGVIREYASSVVGRRSRVANVVLGLQLAALLVLMSTAALFARSLWNLNSAASGFQPQTVAYGSPQFFRTQFPRDRTPGVVQEALEQLNRSPHIASASMVGGLPIVHGSGGWGWVTVPGYTRTQAEDNVVYIKVASSPYFETMGIPLLAGRDFDEGDRAVSAKPVAIVNQHFVRQYFQGRDPLGVEIKMGASPPKRIIGVVADTKDVALREPQRDFIYQPMQSGGWGAIVARAKPGVDPAICEAEIRSTFAALAKGVPVEAGTMESAVQKSLGRDRMVTQLSAAFGILGVLLASIGLYGATAHDMRGRAREIALRMALGAGSWAVLRLVLGRSLSSTALGILIGVPAAIGVGRMLESLLFGITPSDPFALLIAAGTLTAIGVAAGLLPAWRACRLDPITVLRYQ